MSDEVAGIQLSDDELRGLLQAADGAAFAGQWSRDDATCSAVDKLFGEAQRRGLKLDLVDLKPDADEPGSPFR